MDNISICSTSYTELLTEDRRLFSRFCVWNRAFLSWLLRSVRTQYSSDWISPHFHRERKWLRPPGSLAETAPFSASPTSEDEKAQGAEAYFSGKHQCFAERFPRAEYGLSPQVFWELQKPKSQRGRNLGFWQPSGLLILIIKVQQEVEFSVITGLCWSCLIRKRDLHLVMQWFFSDHSRKSELLEIK